MNKEKRSIERVLVAIGLRSSGDSANAVSHFFSSCLKLEKHPHSDQIEQQLIAKPFIDVIDYLLLMHAVEHGFFRLEAANLDITLQVSYNPDSEEDLSPPSLALVGEPQMATPITLIIGRNPDIAIDESMLAYLKEFNRQNVLNVRVEMISERKVGPEPAQQEPMPQLRAVIEALGLPTNLLEENAQELIDSTRLWRTEDALVAHTIVVKNLRVIVGRLAPNQPIEVDRIKPHLERSGSNIYALGVLLSQPFTEREQWNQDPKGYRDFQVGDVSPEKVDEAIHLLLE